MDIYTRIYLVGYRELNLAKTVLEEKNYNVPYPNSLNLIQDRDKYRVLLPIIESEEFFDRQFILYFYEEKDWKLHKMYLQYFAEIIGNGDEQSKTKILLIDFEDHDIIGIIKQINFSCVRDYPKTKEMNFKLGRILELV